MTAPPRPFDGALVPGYIAPESPTCHPPGLLADVRDAVGDYRVYPPDPSTDAERVEWYGRLVEMRGNAFRYLVDRFEPSFGFLQFQQTDTVIHELPGDREALRAVYAAVDRQVERVLAECDPDCVVVVSDHGTGPYDGYEFRVNEFLADRGFVASKRGGEGMPSWASISRKRIRAGEPGGDRERSLSERLFAAGARVGLTSQRLARLVDRLDLTDVVLDVVPPDVVRAATEQVDFGVSTAYMRSRTELGVRLNLEGREPTGVVPPDEYERVRSEVVEALRSARTPDGDPVFEAVLPRETVFEGPYVDRAVDVVTVPAGFDHYLSASLRGSLFDAPSESWNHKLAGVVALAGDRVDPGRGVGDAHLFDVAPTVLSTLGVPPSTRMEGSVLPCVDPVADEEYPAFVDVDGADREASLDADLESRLADLGYLETVHDG